MTSTTPDLPAQADLGQLRTQAKDLRLAVRHGKPGAAERAARSGPVDPGRFSIRDAQHVIALEHGFARWQDVVSAFGNRQPRERDLHRWFAVELNNALGDLLFDLTPNAPRAEQDRALYQAYAACYHWLEAGTPANHGRAEYAIAQTALAIGRPWIAAHHAPRYAELIAEHPGDFTDWDVALSTEILARTAAATGAPDAGELKARARRLADRIADSDAREVVRERLDRGPWFTPEGESDAAGPAD
ncbi:hypothetical protein [Streptomyces rhizosphaerihabitans]|uniref:hypothetical protein n=1 Tax=Streptomyces rhizosphaerihabitans TaxID=1266770 RepID=UPI0021BF9D11|nr:hypothetical protein [Streptomyces rhizosphaerihabitans]MCT9007040.1 hypothetical protein [Streptomyces rhizosphaerihabitans]